MGGDRRRKHRSNRGSGAAAWSGSRGAARTQSRLGSGLHDGLEDSLRLRADVIVNTDADNQYDARDIPALVAPILEGRADLVVGSRPIETIQHFSPIKKLLERIGSWVVRVASKTDVADAPSGFRALSRDAARQMIVFSRSPIRWKLSSKRVRKRWPSPRFPSASTVSFARRA